MLTTSNYQLLSRHGKIDLVVDSKTGKKALLSAAFFPAGHVITKFNIKEIIIKPTYLTVQLDEDRHMLMDPEYLHFANHSCDPNFFIDTERREFVALKDIHIGEELLFFYPSTEWKMDRPFKCECGSPQCIGLISGAYALPEENQKQYRFSKFIAEKLSNIIRQ